MHVVYRSDPQASQVLAKDDVVKVQLGVQIDGFAAISGETIVIGASKENPVTGRRADVIKAAWHAAEIAMRTVKVGNRNWGVTEIVGRVANAWDCKPVEGASVCLHFDLLINQRPSGMLSCQQTQNVIDGKKRIILNPSESQKRDFESATFAEGEVYGIDVLIASSEDGKVNYTKSLCCSYSCLTLQFAGSARRHPYDDLPKRLVCDISA